jgi:hypothetical protein
VADELRASGGLADVHVPTVDDVYRTRLPSV